MLQKRSLLFLPVVAKEIVENMISEEIKNKHRGGRPNKSIKKEILRSIRFSELEYIVIKHKASKASIKVSTYICQMSINGKIISRLNEEERHFVRQLIGMSNNLNQLTKKGHQEGFLTAVLMFDKYKKAFDELLEKIKINDQ